ncbi:MAG: c-type cytochrome [Gammaproteobacteria bacterium]|nr:c-type cytochrome [Gammaproteobacteria bacterium]
MEDRQFTTMFMAVLVGLVGLTIVILVISNVLYNSDSMESDLRVQNAVAERVKPVGEVHIGSVPEGAGPQVVAAAPTQVAAADLSGEQVYQQVCASCHAAAVLNAPKPGDTAAWEPRLAKGIDTLYANAINGIGAMPAKGGRVDMSDDAINAAVDFMIK